MAASAMTETIMPPEMLANLKVRRSAFAVRRMLTFHSLHSSHRSWRRSLTPMASTPLDVCSRSAPASSPRYAGRGARVWCSRPTPPLHHPRYKPSGSRSLTSTQTHNSTFLHSPKACRVLNQDSPTTVPDFDPVVCFQFMISNEC